MVCSSSVTLSLPMHCGALVFVRGASHEPPILDGVYDQISCPTFPAELELMTLWIRLFYEALGAGSHAIGLVITDLSTGEQIGSSGGGMVLPTRLDRLHPSNDISFA